MITMIEKYFNNIQRCGQELKNTDISCFQFPVQTLCIFVGAKMLFQSLQYNTRIEILVEIGVSFICWQWSHNMLKLREKKSERIRTLAKLATSNLVECCFSFIVLLFISHRHLIWSICSFSSTGTSLFILLAVFINTCCNLVNGSRMW